MAKLSPKVAVKVMSYGVVAVSFTYLASVLSTQAANFQGHLDIQVCLVSALLVVNGLLCYGLASWGWWWQLSDGYKLSRTYVYVVYGLSQIAKYLPGNVGHMLGRVALTRGIVTTRDISSSLILEIFIFGVIHAGLGVLFIYRFPQVPISAPQVTGLIIVGMLAAYPTYLFARKKFGITEISPKSIAGLILANGLGALLPGLGTWLLINAYAGSGLVTFEQCLAGASLTFIVGFITPGAPGGVGVREATFVLLFGPLIGATLALEIVILQRIIGVITDVVLFGIAKLIVSIRGPLSELAPSA